MDEAKVIFGRDDEGWYFTVIIIGDDRIYAQGRTFEEMIIDALKGLLCYIDEIRKEKD